MRRPRLLGVAHSRTGGAAAVPAALRPKRQCRLLRSALARLPRCDSELVGSRALARRCRAYASDATTPARWHACVSSNSVVFTGPNGSLEGPALSPTRACIGLSLFANASVSGSRERSFQGSVLTGGGPQARARRYHRGWMPLSGGGSLAW